MSHPPNHDPDHNDTVARKKALRAHAVVVRAAAFAAHGAAAAERLAGLAPSLGIAPGEVVAGYWPMGDEIDPRPLMAALAAGGCRLALPVVTARGQPLDFRAWTPGEALEPGLYGTAHPAFTAAPLVPAALLVPLLAFDRSGVRLGYGGGYYDRTLESLALKGHVKTIGLAFAAQEVATLPRDRHDQPLDAVATEDGLLEMTRR